MMNWSQLLPVKAKFCTVIVQAKSFKAPVKQNVFFTFL